MVLRSGSFQVPFGLQVDQLTAVMLLVVTGVGLLIFIYSKGYMHGDPGYYRFFAYMSLFAFSMLLLVMANNYLLLYFGWEAVGLCSYYLIGFFYHKPEAAAAGKKAFIVNRVGDFGFGLGVMLIFITFGTLNYTGVFDGVDAGVAGQGTLLAIALLLFMGAMGKSAQFPLHVWLPDAMEGPTPVSALIHAATMVTAGVYLVARSAVIFASAPTALIVVGAIGTLTAIFAAVIGICQKDIKKVLAYSTVSQLGYMFMALGVGAWSIAIFHLMTHAFFKALLFLGAGSVIHAMNGEQDMDKMGGLAKKIPATYWTLVAGALALSGIFPFAGFWSKDDILGIGLAARQVLPVGRRHHRGVHHGLLHLPDDLPHVLRQRAAGARRRASRAQEPAVDDHPARGAGHRLAAGRVPGAAGQAGRAARGSSSRCSHRPIDVLGIEEHGLLAIDYILMAVSLVVAMCGIALAWFMYIRRTDLPVLVGAKLRPVYKVVYNKFYIDEFYAKTFVWLAVDGSRWVWKHFDELIIDGAVNGTGWLWQKGGALVRPVQTGKVQNYLLGIFIGLFVLMTVVTVVMFT